MTVKLKYITAALLAGAAVNISSLSLAQTTSEQITPAPQTLIETPVKTAPAASWQGKKVAIRGRDVVSFFENDEPQKGSKEFTANWDNTTWRFASDENRKLFLADPEKYAPQFGGFCPVALADNKAKIGHVNQYSVYNNKLYLNYNKASKKKFSNDPDNFLWRAQLNF